MQLGESSNVGEGSTVLRLVCVFSVYCNSNCYCFYQQSHTLNQNPNHYPPEVALNFTYNGMIGMQHSFPPQKQKNKSHVSECGNETPLGQISILGKQKFPHWGVCHRPDGCTPENQPHRGMWLKRKKRLGPWGKMEERVLEKEEEVVREGLQRVNADSSTKAATAAEGREEHGKRVKVKGTSGGFKFKATVSVCILTTAPHPLSTYTSICNNNCTPTSLLTPQH